MTYTDEDIQKMAEACVRVVDRQDLLIKGYNDLKSKLDVLSERVDAMWNLFCLIEEEYDKLSPLELTERSLENSEKINSLTNYVSRKHEQTLPKIAKPGYKGIK